MVKPLKTQDSYVLVYGQSSTGTIVIENCYSTGEISNKYSGGIFGYRTGYESIGSVTVRNCRSSGNITGEQSGGIVGGHFCRDSTSTILIEKCFSTGLGGLQSGGIAAAHSGHGVAETKTFTLKECYTTGLISGEKSGGITVAFLVTCLMVLVLFKLL